VIQVVTQTIIAGRFDEQRRDFLGFALRQMKILHKARAIAIKFKCMGNASKFFLEFFGFRGLEEEVFPVILHFDQRCGLD
jgi:hypothetical protein